MANAPKLYYKLTDEPSKGETVHILEELMTKAQLTDSQKEAFRKCGFAQKPASFRYHNNFEGGLVIHCNNVADRLVELINLYHLSEFTFNPYKVALCHDLCKAFYNRKNKDGEWYYESTALPGHAEASLMICQAEPFAITFSPEELLAIRWHMGAYLLEKEELNAYDKAIDKSSNLALIMHHADMVASRFDEQTYPAISVRKEWEN